MPNSSFQNKILLGCGGTSPQLIMWDYITNFFVHVIYPKFNSIYTIAVNQEMITLATGTRNGLIFIHDLAQIQDNVFPIKKTLTQGSPVLSLCWLENNFLAVSDKAGRCFIWDIEKESSFQVIETHGEIICDLFHKDTTLFGFSMKNKIHLWDLKTKNQFMEFKIPDLPKIGALVNSIYWPANSTLVFPITEGKLSLYNIKNQTRSIINAHKGDFYALTLYGDRLASFGMDQQFKVWCKGINNLALSYPCNKKVISSVCLSSQQNRFLLIDYNGTAYEYVLETESLKLIQQLPGQNYRVCAVLFPDSNHHFKNKVQLTQAHTIANKILNRDEQITVNTLNNYYKKLSDMNFHHVRLALQADQAEQDGDFFKAIEFNIELLHMIPKNNKDTCTTMEKYVSLLEKTWNFAEVRRISENILKIDSFNIYAKGIINTYNFSGINQDSWIIEPDIPLETIFKAATAVKNICGRYVIKSLNRIVCEKNILTAKLISKKFQEIQHEKGDPLFKISIESVRCFSNKGYEDLKILSFSNGLNNDSQYIQLAVRLISSNSGTIVIPIVLFDCRNYYMKKTSCHNIDLLDMYTRIKNCPSSSMYLRGVHKAFYHALQRLLTQETERKTLVNDQ